jgi:two-component sensor histidine kinase
MNIVFFDLFNYSFCKPTYIFVLFFLVINGCLIFKYRQLLNKNTLANNLKCELNKTLKEKELLLKELHHRVKNNLQIVVSLLNIQARVVKLPEIDLFIERTETRIKSMLMIHEMLCFSHDVSKVDFKEYTQDLICNIYNTYDNINHIRYKINMETIEFDIETAIPLGLILNELINNSFKYGFPFERPGEVQVSLIAINEKSYKLIVKDNGIGFDINVKKFGSIGINIVTLLVDQMSGDFQIKTNNGVEYVILFCTK